MKITVALCTWNRASLLAQTLEAMTHLRVPSEIDWELLAVNNKCTDGTDQVIASYGGRLPLRRLYEPSSGKSYACNLAVREADGDYILWTDDDVLVDADWIAAYGRAFCRYPTAAVFAGRIDPWFAGKTPLWLSQVFPPVASRLFRPGLWKGGAPAGCQSSSLRREYGNPYPGPKKLSVRPESWPPGRRRRR